MVKVHHGDRHGAAAPPRQAAGGAELTRIVFVSLIGAIGALARRARARAPPATAGALLDALAGHLPGADRARRRAGPARPHRRRLGIAYPPNALFIAAFGFVLLVLLNFSIAVSRLSEQTSRLAQRLAMLEERVGPAPGGRARVARRARTPRWRATDRRSGRPRPRWPARRCLRGRAPSARARTSPPRM